MKHTKIVEIGGKNYTLVANRNIVRAVHNLIPSMRKQKQLSQTPTDKEIEEQNATAQEVAIETLENLDKIFYELLKPAHGATINQEKATALLDKMEEEYKEVQPKLLKFAMSSFTQGDQDKPKKELNL